MKTNVLLLLLTFLTSSCVAAAPLPEHPRKHATVVVAGKPKRHVRKPAKVVVVKKVVVGTRVKAVPADRVIIYFNSIPYFYADGTFYRKISAVEYEVVTPQRGMLLPLLPHHARRIRLHGKPYFLSGDILYRKINTPAGVRYEVTGTINQ